MNTGMALQCKWKIFNEVRRKKVRKDEMLRQEGRVFPFVDVSSAAFFPLKLLRRCYELYFQQDPVQPAPQWGDGAGGRDFVGISGKKHIDQVVDVAMITQLVCTAGTVGDK